MILAGNQPYFLPYLGWWQLLKAADIFLIADDYNFIKSGWIARNRILVEGKPYFFRIEIKRGGSNRLINRLELLPVNVKKKLKTLEFAYRKAPFFENGYTLAERILAYPESNLSLFLENSIREVCSYLGITTPLERHQTLKATLFSNGRAAFTTLATGLEPTHISTLSVEHHYTTKTISPVRASHLNS